MLRTSGEQGKTWGEKWDNQKTKMRRITTHEELRELYGEPVSKVENKIHQRLNRQATEFIARSPLMLLATSDEAGGLEVSPRGDRPGFVRVEGDNVLLIPDRTGNRLVFLFPLVLDGHPAPWREGLRLTRRAGGTLQVMRTVIRLASTMLLGGFADGRFVRAWCLGCLAVVLWYEEVRRA